MKKYASFDTSILRNVSILESEMSNGNISEYKLTNLELDDVSFIKTSFLKRPLMV